MFYSLVSGGGKHLSRGKHHWKSLKGRVSDVRQLKKKKNSLHISLFIFLYQHRKIKLEQGFPGGSDS